MHGLLALWLAATPVPALEADLDGDGRPEKLSIASGDGAYTLKVGGTSVTGQVGEKTVHGITVEDIDTGDRSKEIAVHITGLMDWDHLVVVYTWGAGKLSEAGRLRSLGEVKGNGILLVDEWMGFWFRREKHQLDRAARKLKRVPQDLYFVGFEGKGIEGKVEGNVVLKRSRTDPAAIATLAKGSTVQLLACDPSPKAADDFWYLIKSGTGLLGWVRQKELQAIGGLPWAG